MNKILKMIIIICFMFQTISLAVTVFPPETVEIDGKELARYSQGGQLSNTPNYDWWYGCSPTAAGMMIGYYDRNNFDNLVPGGDAELNSFISTPGSWDYLAQYVIASPEHVSDFYSGGYGASGDDVFGSWHNIYQGGFTRLAWNEKDLGGSYQVDQMRFRFYNGSTSSIVSPRLCETDFWEADFILDWITPTGGYNWVSNSNARDDDTYSFAQGSAGKESWSGFIYLSHDPLSVSKIRFWPRDDTWRLTLVDVDVNYEEVARNFDSLADFMGTSQDNLSTQFGGNSNGSTGFWTYTDNSPLTKDDIFALGSDYYNISGMYGISEYFEYIGYDLGVLYNQRIYGYDGISAGFTFEQYKAEIDAGRPVMIHIEGHSMLGYGYLDDTNIIKVFDTWAPNGQNPGTMLWGGSYPFGELDLTHFGVTVMTPLPEPATIVILGLGVLILISKRK